VDATHVSERTTVGVFLRQSAALGDHVCARHHDGTAWRDVTWAEMAERARRVAARLLTNRVAFGDRVALMAENSLEWLVCDVAIQLAGAVTVPVYPSTTEAVTRQIIANCGAVLAFAGDAARAERLAPLPTVRMDEDLAAWLATEPDAEALAELEARAARLSPDDLVTIAYTSGTTGRPKGVALAHRNIIDMAHCCLAAFHLDIDDVALSFLPYSHVLERINGVYVGMVAGSGMWLGRGSAHLMEDMQECRPTVMVSVPRIYEKMHQTVMARVRGQPPYRRALFHWAVSAGLRRSRGQRSPLYPLADRLVLGPLRRRLTGGRLRFFITGGAPMTREVEEFFWSLGIRILQGWGMTETSSAATANTETEHKFETGGRPLPGVELRIADDGEILVRSPGTMLGYYQDPESTAAIMDGEWVRTGDIGELDRDGFLHITDRKKDLIKTAGGKYVAPQPLEAALAQDALIERVVVIGDLKPYVSALVVPDWDVVRHQLDIDGTPEELVWDERVRDAIQGRVNETNAELGSWETIKRFTLLPRDFREDTGELTPTLKVKRRVIQERYADLIADMYAAPRERAGA
jgi:long-chain acyl-CoA synthetase